MSCQKKKPVVPCKDTTTCPTVFRGKKCKCVTNVNSKNCDSLQITCAYEEDGYLYACPVGCCQNQCDGSCPSTFFKISDFLSSTCEWSPETKFIVILAILLGSLILLSTLSLF